MVNRLLIQKFFEYFPSAKNRIDESDEPPRG